MWAWQAVCGNVPSLSRSRSCPGSRAPARADALLEAPAAACATNVWASRIAQNNLRYQCRLCGHGVASAACNAHARGARGGSANQENAIEACLTRYGRTRVKCSLASAAKSGGRARLSGNPICAAQGGVLFKKRKRVQATRRVMTDQGEKKRQLNRATQPGSQDRKEPRPRVVQLRA